MPNTKEDEKKNKKRRKKDRRKRKKKEGRIEEDQEQQQEKNEVDPQQKEGEKKQKRESIPEENPSKKSKLLDPNRNKVVKVGDELHVNGKKVNKGDIMEALFDKRWYPGKVMELSSSRVKIHFDDDDSTHSFSANIRFHDINLQ